MSCTPLATEDAARCRASLLASEQEFRSEWLAAADKVAVPVEELAAFSDDPLGERIVAAYQAVGDEQLLCLTTHDLGPTELIQAAVVATDPGELDAWRGQVHPFDVVFASRNLDRATLVSVDEFGLIVGAPAFVEDAIGVTLAEARKSFAAYAEDMKRASRHLPAIASKYGCV
jgi:hypothetical protein